MFEPQNIEHRTDVTPSGDRHDPSQLICFWRQFGDKLGNSTGHVVMKPAVLRCLLTSVLLVFAFASQSSAGSAVVITEFMAANSTTLADEDGEFSDWIEIHNV